MPVAIIAVVITDLKRQVSLQAIYNKIGLILKSHLRYLLTLSAYSRQN